MELRVLFEGFVEKKVRNLAQYGTNYPDNFGTNFGIFQILGPLPQNIY
jgi:hypothetical protein